MRAKRGRWVWRTWLATRTATFSKATGLTTGGLVGGTTRNWGFSCIPSTGEAEAAARARQLRVAHVLKAGVEGPRVRLQHDHAVGVGGARERALHDGRAAPRDRAGGGGARQGH